MSVTAPAPSAPPPTRLVAGLRSMLPAARAHFGLAPAAAGTYRSAFPPRLRRGRAAILVLSVLWCLLGFRALNGTASILHTIGHDTAPSVAAAERIRTGVSSANADFALAILSDEGNDGPFLADMRRQLRGVRAALVAAAENVTFGDEERGPIGTVLQGLGTYEGLVGRARASGGDARRALVFEADEALHWTVLPAAATLERVNADHLDRAYVAYRAGWLLAPFAGIAAALLLVLVAVQADMARTARRLVNPLMALSTLAAAAATAAMVLGLAAAQSDVRIAKADAFDSVYSLSTAGALAADADAAQSFFLLARGDAARRARTAADFASRAERLLSRDPAEIAAAVRNDVPSDGDDGYLGAAVANITFAGERDALVAVLDAWRTVLAADAVLRAADAAGQGAAAVASKTADAPGGARAAFAGFDAALALELGINADAFAAAVDRAERDTGPLAPVLLGGAVVVLAAAWLGIRRRLDDYRF